MGESGLGFMCAFVSACMHVEDRDLFRGIEIKSVSLSLSVFFSLSLLLAAVQQLHQ